MKSEERKKHTKSGQSQNQQYTCKNWSYMCAKSCSHGDFLFTCSHTCCRMLLFNDNKLRHKETGKQTDRWQSHCVAVWSTIVSFQSSI